MSIKYLKNAISIGSAKEAALYFDVVVPLDLISGMTKREIDHSIWSEKKPEKILKSLLPIIDDSMSFYRGHVAISDTFWGIVGLQKEFQEHGTCESYFDQQEEFLTIIRNSTKLALNEDFDNIAQDIDNGLYDLEIHRNKFELMLDSGIESLGLDVYSTWRDHHYHKIPHDIEPTDVLDTEDVSLVLQGLDFVNIENLSWRKILEIRKDKKALSELRDLRNFLHKDLSGLEHEAALDIINADIERYKEQVRIWGLDTAKKSLSMIASKEGVGLTSLGAIASFAMTGVPIDPIAATAAVMTAIKSGAVLNLTGSATLQILEAKIERKKVDCSPESHIRYLQRLS